MNYTINGKTFAQVWAEKEAEGYQYGEDALEQVRFGWDIAASHVEEQRKAESQTYFEVLKGFEERAAEAREYIAALELVLYKRSHVMEKDMADALEIALKERDVARAGLDDLNDENDLLQAQIGELQAELEKAKNGNC